MTNRDRGGEPDPSRNLRHVGMPYPEYSSIFPGLFRSEKNREKLREIRKNQGKSGKIEGNQEKSREIGEYQGKLGKIEENRGKSGKIPTFPDIPQTFQKRLGWPSRLIPALREKLRWPSRPIPKMPTALNLVEDGWYLPDGK